MSLKLLDELLRVISDFEVPNESPEEGPLKPPSPSVIPKPMKLLTAPAVSTECIPAPLESVQCEEVEYGCLQWLQALEYLPCVLAHTAPMVSFFLTFEKGRCFDLGASSSSYICISSVGCFSSLLQVSETLMNFFLSFHC